MTRVQLDTDFEPTACENNCGSDECDQYWGGTGWVCQECRDNLESDEQWDEEHDGQPSEHDEWMSYDPDC